MLFVIFIETNNYILLSISQSCLATQRNDNFYIGIYIDIRNLVSKEIIKKIKKYVAVHVDFPVHKLMIFIIQYILMNLKRLPTIKGSNSNSSE